MMVDKKLAAIGKELDSLRVYIKALQLDGTITNYTAGSMIAKIDRCDAIIIKPIISPNR